MVREQFPGKNKKIFDSRAPRTISIDDKEVGVREENVEIKEGVEEVEAFHPADQLEFLDNELEVFDEELE